jgi:hypothetical protein
VRRVVAVVGALAVAVVPSAASAGARTQHGPAVLRPSVQQLAHQWLVAERAAIRRIARVARIEGPTLGGYGATSTAVQLATLTPVGDLSGIGHSQVLDERQNHLFEQAGALGVTLRDGRTGRGLWRRTFNEPGGAFVSVLPIRLGSNGRRGLLAVDESSGTDSSGDEVVTLGLLGLSGASGKTIWHQRFSGLIGSAGASNEPRLVGLITGSSQDQALIDFDTTMSPDLTVTADTVATGTGIVAPFGGSVSSQEAFPTMQMIPDLNGDGVSDVLLEVLGSGGYVRTLSGATADSIWTSDDLPLTFSIAALPIAHYSSKRVPDLAFSTIDNATETGRVYVLRGTTGNVLWQRAGNAAVVLGKAGKKLVPALGVLNFHDTITGPTTAVSVVDSAITAGNKVLYTKHFGASVPMKAGLDPFLENGVQAFGDVQPDGSLDSQVLMAVSVRSHGKTHRDAQIGIADGRTGRFRSMAFQFASVGSLRKGNGTDLLSVSLAKGRPRITAWRGATGKRYYRRVIAGVGTAKTAWLTGVRVSGHSCSDLALGTVTKSHGLVGIVDAQGAPLWTVRFAKGHDTGGTLKRFKPPAHFCV